MLAIPNSLLPFHIVNYSNKEENENFPYSLAEFRT